MKTLIKLKKFLARLPLFFILLGTYVFIVFLIIISFGYFAFSNSRSLSIDKTNTYTGILMNELNDQLTNKMQSVIDTSFDISNDEDLIGILSTYGIEDSLYQFDADISVKKIINIYWRSKPEVININFFVKDKKITNGFHNNVCPISLVEDYDWFKMLGNKKGILTDAHMIAFPNEFGKKYVITSLVKVDNRMISVKPSIDNNINVEKDTISNPDDSLGIVAVDVSEDYFYDNILEKNKISTGSQIFVMNDKGVIISSYDKTIIETSFLKDENIGRIVKNKDSGYERVKKQGKEYLLIYTALSKINWRVVQLIPVGELYIGQEKIVRSVIFTALIFILVTLPIAVLLSRFISKPIVRLAKTMKRVESDGLRLVTDQGFSNEIMELYRDYNIMVRRIDRLIDDNNKANEVSRKAELKALQAQINPHFLYNTLDSINWMALDNNAPEISKMVTMLSRLFRLSLNKGKSVCTVRDEIGHVGYYLEIQKIRFKNRFQFNFDIPVNVLDYNTLKLILQPLVENSIIHGFNEIASGGVILITARIQDERLILDVIDNGKGIKEDQAMHILEQDSKEGGYGIKNVNERIQYACGKEYGLMYIFEETEGTHVRINLPLTLELESTK